MYPGDTRSPWDVIDELQAALDRLDRSRAGSRADRQRRGFHLRILAIQLEAQESAISTLGLGGVTDEALERRDRIHAQYKELKSGFHPVRFAPVLPAEEVPSAFGAIPDRERSPPRALVSLVPESVLTSSFPCGRPLPPRPPAPQTLSNTGCPGPLQGRCRVDIR